MPILNRYETYSILKENKETKDIPIILVNRKK